jgi:hypothetical protein
MSSEIIIYENQDGNIKIDVRLEEETVWLTQEQIAVLFGKGRSTVTEHIGNVFKEGELKEEVACRHFRLTTPHGAIEGKTQEKGVKHYNLDVIISVGYRVNSTQATAFRIWATERLKEYIIKGFTMDDERMKNLGGGGYWKELLKRIRDIRTSEKVFTARYWKFIQPAWTMTPKRMFRLNFSKRFKTKFILLFTHKPQPA